MNFRALGRDEIACDEDSAVRIRHGPGKAPGQGPLESEIRFRK